MKLPLSQPLTEIPETLASAKQAFKDQAWDAALGAARRTLATSRDDDETLEALSIAARCQWHRGDLVDCCRLSLKTALLSELLGSDAVTHTICALTLASFALAELDLASEALPRALRALELARTPNFEHHLPLVLSCAAHVQARLGAIEQAELLHMQALSHARQSHRPNAIQMACDNLLVSFIAAYRELAASNEWLLAAAVLERSRKHVAYFRGVIADTRLEDWRRLSLKSNLGKLLGLQGESQGAENMLLEVLREARSRSLIDQVHHTQAALAELLLNQGRAADAWSHLQDGALLTSVNSWGLSKEKRLLTTAIACLQRLGREAEAVPFATRLNALAQAHDAMRRSLMGYLSDSTEREPAERSLLQCSAELTELTHRLMVQERATTRRFAQTLHDKLGQTLTAILYAFVSEAVLDDERLALRHRRVDHLIDQAIAEMRQVLTDLRPMLLEEYGLARALENEIGVRLKHVAGVVSRVCIGPELVKIRWPVDVEYSAFMIVREAVANALQHSGCTELSLTIEGEAARFAIEVIDNGIGPTAVAQKDGHLGIVGMRERAAAIGAELSIGPAPDAGTAILLNWEEAPS